MVILQGIITLRASSISALIWDFSAAFNRLYFFLKSISKVFRHIGQLSFSVPCHCSISPDKFISSLYGKPVIRIHYSENYQFDIPDEEEPVRPQKALFINVHILPSTVISDDVFL